MKRDAMSSILIAVVLLALGVIAEAQARTAADPSDDVAGIDPGQEITGLAASVLTRPSAVRGTDGRFHIAYELVLTGATRFAVERRASRGSRCQDPPGTALACRA